MQLAISRQNLKIARALLEKRPNLNFQDRNKMSSAHFAIDNNSMDMLKFCLDNGQNIELKDTFGWTLLMRAIIMQCDAEIVQYLLEKGADISVVDKNGLSCFDHVKLIGNILSEKLAEAYNEVLPKSTIICEELII